MKVNTAKQRLQAMEVEDNSKPNKPARWAVLVGGGTVILMVVIMFLLAIWVIQFLLGKIT